MLRKLFACFVLSMLALAAQAQEGGIHVVGFGNVRTEPDIATFNFGIQGQTDTAADAMQRADKNIDELLEELNGTFHRSRQSGIDEELFDVIAGFEALSEEKN